MDGAGCKKTVIRKPLFLRKGYGEKKHAGGTHPVLSASKKPLFAKSQQHPPPWLVVLPTSKTASSPKSQQPFPCISCVVCLKKNTFPEATTIYCMCFCVVCFKVQNVSCIIIRNPCFCCVVICGPTYFKNNSIPEVTTTLPVHFLCCLLKKKTLFPKSQQ